MDVSSEREGGAAGLLGCVPQEGERQKARKSADAPQGVSISWPHPRLCPDAPF